MSPPAWHRLRRTGRRLVGASHGSLAKACSIGFRSGSNFVTGPRASSSRTCSMVHRTVAQNSSGARVADARRTRALLPRLSITTTSPEGSASTSDIGPKMSPLTASKTREVDPSAEGRDEVRCSSARTAPRRAAARPSRPAPKRRHVGLIQVSSMNTSRATIRPGGASSAPAALSRRGAHRNRLKLKPQPQTPDRVVLTRRGSRAGLKSPQRDRAATCPEANRELSTAAARDRRQPNLRARAAPISPLRTKNGGDAPAALPARIALTTRSRIARTCLPSMLPPTGS